MPDAVWVSHHHWRAILELVIFVAYTLLFQKGSNAADCKLGTRSPGIHEDSPSKTTQRLDCFNEVDFQILNFHTSLSSIALLRRTARPFRVHPFPNSQNLHTALLTWVLSWCTAPGCKNLGGPPKWTMKDVLPLRGHPPLPHPKIKQRKPQEKAPKSYFI